MSFWNSGRIGEALSIFEASLDLKCHHFCLVATTINFQEFFDEFLNMCE